MIGIVHHAAFRTSSDVRLASDAPFLPQAPVSTHTAPTILTNLNNTTWARVAEATVHLIMADLMVTTTTAVAIIVAEATALSLSELVTGDAAQKDAHTTTSQRMSIAFDAVLLVRAQLLSSTSPSHLLWALHHLTLAWVHQAPWQAHPVLDHMEQVLRPSALALPSPSIHQTLMPCLQVWALQVQDFRRWAA